MIKVHYEHPPRKWDFYAGLIIRIGIVNLPIGLSYFIWMFFLPVEVNLLVALVASIIRFAAMRRCILEGYITDYDSTLDKSKDISHERLFPSGEIVEGVQIAEGLGFTRFGETSSYYGFENSNRISWFFINESKDIVIELLALEPLTKYFVGFSTWFDKERVVITFFPFGDSFNHDDLWVEGISTSLETAYNFHLRRIAEFENLHGAPIKFDSFDAFRKYDVMFATKHQKKLLSNARLRNLYVLMIGTIFISSLVFWGVSMFILFLQGDFPQIAPLMLANSLIALVYVGIGLVLLRFINPTPSRDISQAKKKAS